MRLLDNIHIHMTSTVKLDTIIDSAVNVTNVTNNIISESYKIIDKGMKVVDSFADQLIYEAKLRELERKKAELAKSTYVSPAYDEEELIELFRASREKGLDYVIIGSNEIKKKTIELMQNSNRAKYKFTNPSLDEIENMRPDLLQNSCCRVQSINLSEFVKISFSLF